MGGVMLNVLLPSLADAQGIGTSQEYCRGTQSLQPLSIFYRMDVPRAPIGTPLDAALRSEQAQVARIREQAKLAFLTRPPVELAKAMENYTFLTPDSEKDSYALGGLVAMTDISAALKYRKLLWRRFIEQFTTVREAASENPYVLRFQVSLDLSYYCRYRQRIENLVTR